MKIQVCCPERPNFMPWFRRCAWFSGSTMINLQRNRLHPPLPDDENAAVP